MATTTSRPSAFASSRPRNSKFTSKGNGKPKAEPKIIQQSYFKSVGPRTYAAQVKELSNGNHLLVLTEGKRDDATNEVRKTRLFVYAEDFPALFKMLDESRAFIESHPVSAEAQAKRDRYWANQKQTDAANAKAPPPPPAAVSEPDEDLDG